jgi:hypothetical protein
MNARYFLTAALGVLVISTAAYAGSLKSEGHINQEHDTNKHTSRDDLVTWCQELPVQYANTAALQHTADTDKLRDEGVELCRAGSREPGVEKLKDALGAFGATPFLD